MPPSPTMGNPVSCSIITLCVQLNFIVVFVSIFDKTLQELCQLQLSFSVKKVFFGGRDYVEIMGTQY